MTTNAKEHYQAGRLAEAIAAQAAEVKAHPASIEVRGLLCELLSFGADLDRIDKHLDVMGRQDPKLELGIAEFRQVIRSEQARRDCFLAGAAPGFIGEPTPLLQQHLLALTMLRTGDAAGAAAVLAEAEEQRPHVSGSCDGVAFSDFRDLDDVCAPFLEVLTTTGKYYWVPIERVAWIDFVAPKRIRDIVWRQAEMCVRGGPEGTVYLPVTYAGSHASSEERLQLGRGTEWTGGEGAPVRGVGQRMFLIGDEARPILDLGRLELGSQES